MALGRGWMVCHGPASLPLERDLVSFVQEAGLASGPVWKGTEDITPTGD